MSSLAIICAFLFQCVHSQSCTAVTGVEFTFYGYPDGNSDTTSFSCSDSSSTRQWSHGGNAGGNGTYTDPETFATALTSTKFTECEIIYIPYFQKYFRYNDHCQKCASDLANGLTHLDLWIGSSMSGGQAQILCEETLGALRDQMIILNPPNDLPVNGGALWDGSTCHNSPSSSMIFPDPKTDGICSGGSYSPGGGSPAPAPAPSPSPATSTTVPTITPVTPTPAAVNSPQQIKADDKPAPSPSISLLNGPGLIFPSVDNVSKPFAAVVSSSPTPTTLVTFILTSTLPVSPQSAANRGKTWVPGIAYTQQMAAAYAGCASWNGCIGDSCQSYNDCAGDWICIAGECADNRYD